MTDAMKSLVGAQLRYVDLFKEEEEPKDASEIISGLRNRLKAVNGDK